MDITHPSILPGETLVLIIFKIPLKSNLSGPSEQKYLNIPESISILVNWRAEWKNVQLTISTSESNLNTVQSFLLTQLEELAGLKIKSLGAPKDGLFQDTTKLTNSYGLWNTDISFMPTSNKLMEHILGYQMKTDCKSHVGIRGYKWALYFHPHFSTKIFFPYPPRNVRQNNLQALQNHSLP